MISLLVIILMATAVSQWIIKVRFMCFCSFFHFIINYFKKSFQNLFYKSVQRKKLSSCSYYRFDLKTGLTKVCTIFEGFVVAVVFFLFTRRLSIEFISDRNMNEFHRKIWCWTFRKKVDGNGDEGDVGWKDVCGSVKDGKFMNTPHECCSTFSIYTENCNSVYFGSL